MTRSGEHDSLRTLIVEDHAFFREAFKERLQTLFPLMVIQEAATASEALQKVVAFSPDLIFMDIRLPDGNGLEVTQKVKANCPKAAVIILTNYDLPEYRNAAAEFGAETYLSKNSFSWEEMKKLVESVKKRGDPSLPGNLQTLRDGSQLAKFD